eukprot:TRINITY_DN7083_c0_g1_i1.p1 TRINITY_DN7083_c0_g1~~TRINITY_DN7083_c0_g1_i1.p1  ORF type:complete len:492 (-),score=93.99 TRINITY_DN7083_c0_g1_i1:72-1433(-)
MKYPKESDFRFDTRAHPIHIKGSQTIGDLLGLFEAAFKTACEGELELMITMVWNTKDQKKPLNPTNKICEHFDPSDTFGVFGDIKLAEAVELRFKVGTRVLCLTGNSQWDTGTIMELHFRDDGWPPDHTVPYLVMLDDGAYTIVPQDVNHLCKELVLPWWESLLAKPISQLAEQATMEIAAALQRNDINERNYKGETALMAAVAKNWTVGVQTLLKMKASVDSVDKKGMCALHRACSCGPSMVGLLVAARANPNLQDIDPDFDPEFTSTTFGDHPEHRTPLHYSCLEGDLESARLLVQARADMNVQDGRRMSPLHLAIEENKDAVVDFLLKSGADVDLCSLTSGMKNSPLMDAAHKGKHVLAGKLLASGANVNKIGKQDMTALHLAARRGDPKTVKILLEARADATLESKCGTALHLARKHNSAELLQLFGVAEASGAGTALTQAQRTALYMD